VVRALHKDATYWGKKSKCQASTCLCSQINDDTGRAISQEQFKSGLKTWLVVQTYSQETPLRNSFKRHFTNARHRQCHGMKCGYAKCEILEARRAESGEHCLQEGQ